MWAITSWRMRFSCSAALEVGIVQVSAQLG